MEVYSMLDMSGTRDVPVMMNEVFDLEKAIEAYGKPILRYCHGILCNYHDAQDAVQLTFIKAYRADFKADKSTSSLGSWLYRIAYHTCLDMLRKRKRILRFMEKATSEASCYQMEAPYISEGLKAALLTLSAKDRALVLNRVIDEMEYNELADIYGASPSALRKRYERAKKKLASNLEGGMHNG
ncbi:MAG: sigma-70 family RNA polymerase sigma factor [Defluviitaleaceae bacterium]|nr:sigma-70 family RNA polymerase sigma factor [Defluviitaleaceae bacterium]